MTDRKPKIAFSFLLGDRPLVSVVALICLFVGWGLVKTLWPDSNVGVWAVLVIVVGSGIYFMNRKRDRD